MTINTNHWADAERLYACVNVSSHSNQHVVVLLSQEVRPKFPRARVALAVNIRASVDGRVDAGLTSLVEFTLRRFIDAVVVFEAWGATTFIDLGVRVAGLLDEGQKLPEGYMELQRAVAPLKSEPHETERLRALKDAGVAVIL
jgi:hypothetical protein